MKKYVMLLLFVMNALNGMSDAKRMHIALHDSSFDHFLTIYNLPIENRSIFHIGCSTGENSVKLAQKASRVHAFDPHQNLIDIARNNYQNLNNIFFEHCSSAHFDCPRSCDIALIDYTAIDTYTTTNEDRKTFFQCVNQHLSQDGEMFLSIPTSDNRLHPNIATAMNMAPVIQQYMPHMTEQEIIELMTPLFTSTQDLRAMLDETGFEIISTEEQNITITMSAKDLCDAYCNIIIQNPMFGCIQNKETRAQLGTLFIHTYLHSLQKNNEGELLEPVITTIIRARKK